jgi:predicted Zn finger-like uncharacterized protein
MKISCQSCHSKYNVADEKVQGKIVKIRCRKCGSTIVVNGTLGAATNGSAPAPLPAGAADSPGMGLPDASRSGAAGEWHVSVTDGDQRTMSLEELVTAYNAGDVAQDAFIWTEGMEDWKPLGEVDTVVSALYAFAGQGANAEPAGGPGHAAPAPVAASPSYEHASYERPSHDHASHDHAPPAPAIDRAPAAYGEAIATHMAAGPSVAPEAKRAAVVKREARARDLFATRSGEELQTSAPMPPGSSPMPGDDGRLTGQRNENSVLFSLDHLTRNAAPTPRQEPTKGGYKDDSGLIDLKALAAKAESMRPPSMAQNNPLAPPLGFAAPLGSPIGGYGPGPETQPKSKLPLLIGAGAGIAILMVVCIVIGLKIGGAASPAVAATASASPSAAPSGATAEPAASASASAAAQAAASASDAAPAAGAPKPHAYAGGGGWKPNAAPAGGGAAKPAGATPAAGGGGGASPAPASKKGDCGCNGDLLCMMKCSTH